ncbi:MAG: SDR family oxidoreductase [Candidatus Riflebacteria bacterium]|jgi:NAD(P)-dependent dehydrogenase (short-subunit alcohol dehydrogenase family)|nr:SDR family oxidoreductase [Candidatus Riflebacteria bacterium]
MIFDRNENKDVIALLGAGSMGTAIVKRIATGKKILLGDISEKNLEKVSNEFKYGGYDVETIVVNALEKDSVTAFAEKAASLGKVMYFIDTAGASPNQATPEHILNLDMVGTGYAVDAFGKVMGKGGAGLLISSQAGYMYPIPYEIELEILKTPTEKLLDLPFIKETVKNSGLAYMIAKRVNHLQAQKAAATTWRERRARINSMSPGVIVTPLAYDEFAAIGDLYQNMIDASAAMRTGTSEEIADAAAFLLGEHSTFITGTDLLIDGGVMAAIRTGQYKLGN